MPSKAKKAGALALAALATLLAAALAVWLAWPRLVAAPAGPRDQAFQAEFSISNAGRGLAAGDLRAACYVRDFRVVTGGGLHNAGAAPGAWVAARLAAGERGTLPCVFGSWAAPARSAEVLVLTSFAVQGLPWHTAACDRFTGSFADGWRWEEGPCPAEAKRVVELFLADELPPLDLGQEFVP